MPSLLSPLAQQTSSSTWPVAWREVNQYDNVRKLLQKTLVIPAVPTSSIHVVERPNRPLPHVIPSHCTVDLQNELALYHLGAQRISAINDPAIKPVTGTVINHPR